MLDFSRLKAYIIKIKHPESVEADNRAWRFCASERAALCWKRPCISFMLYHRRAQGRTPAGHGPLQPARV